MRSIDITKLNESKSSMDIITTDDLIFLMFDRTDLMDLAKTPYQYVSGIYLLIGEE